MRTNQYEVQEASSGEQTINALIRESCDVVIVDHQVLQASKPNVMEWLVEHNKRLPVIVLIADGSASAVAEIVKRGAAQCIRKDQVEVNRFPALVNAALERHRLRMDQPGDELKEKRAALDAPVRDFFSNTGNTFAQSTDALIGVIADEFDEYQTRLRPNLSPSARSDVDRMMKSFEDQLKLISLFTKTLSDVALLAVQQHIGNGQRTPGEAPIRKMLNRLEEEE
jgi:CheY-like chemotaxis protein